jgi:hypothetical protein
MAGPPARSCRPAADGALGWLPEGFDLAALMVEQVRSDLLDRSLSVAEPHIARRGHGADVVMTADWSAVSSERWNSVTAPGSLIMDAGRVVAAQREVGDSVVVVRCMKRDYADRAVAELLAPPAGQAQDGFLSA